VASEPRIAPPTDRLGGDQHLPGTGLRDRELDDGEALGASERLHRNRFHHRTVTDGGVRLLK
jgi:hypothetical protein